MTRYIFPAHDFSADSEYLVSISLDGDDVNESTWLAYMVSENGWKYQISGQAYGSEYKFYHSTSNGSMVIGLVDGPGEVYDPIEIVRIETSETVDNRKQKEDSIIPDQLDTSNYQEVAEYYGFYQ